MSDLVKVIVKCSRRGQPLAAYSISYPVTLGPSAPPPRESFINEAKINLSNERLAHPPFDDIQFDIVRS